MRAPQAYLRSDSPTLGQDQMTNHRWAWLRVFLYAPDARPGLTKGLETTALFLGLLFTMAFAILATVRMFYPFEISWSESAMLSMSLRRLHGEPMYVNPSLLGGATCLYPPLFFDLSALVARALHLGPDQVSFLPMRLLSIVSCLAVLVGIVWLLRRSKGLSWKMAIALAAIFPATYGRMDFWYDNARVDNLFLFFLFASTAVLIEGRSLWSAVLAGALGGLATLTKQPALLLLGLAGFPTVFVKRQFARAAAFALAFVGTVVGYLFLTGDLFNPAFYFWVLKLPGSHPLLLKNIVRGPLFLAVVLPFLAFFSLIPVVLRFTSKRRVPWTGVRSPDRSWAFVFVLWTLLSLILRGKDGASVNYFMPLVPIGIIAISEGFVYLARRGFDGRRLAALTAVAQLAILAYNPGLFIPTKQAAVEAGAIVDFLRKVDGPVWFAAFPSYAAMAGKPWVTQYGTLLDLSSTNPGYVAGHLSALIRERHFGALVLHTDDHFVNRDELGQFYEEQPLPEVHSSFLRRVHHIHVTGSLFVRRKPN
jgi:hypothetical protein